MHTLIQYARTTEERDVVLSEVTNLINALYKTDDSIFLKMLNTAVSVRTAELIHTLLTEKGIQIESRQAVNDLLNQLKTDLVSCTVLDATLAIKPQHQFLTNLSEWINSNIGENILIQLKIDPQILGGIILIYRGKYFNMSLQKKVSDLLEKDKDAIFSLLS